MKVLVLFLVSLTIFIVKGAPLDDETKTTLDPKNDIEIFEPTKPTTTQKPTTKITTIIPLKEVTTPASVKEPTTRAAPVNQNKNEIVTRNIETLTPRPVVKSKEPVNPKNSLGLEPVKSMDNVLKMMNLMESDKGHTKDFKEWREKWESLWRDGKKYLPWGPFGPWGDNDFDFWYKYYCPPYYVYTHRFQSSYSDSYYRTGFHISDPYWRSSSPYLWW